jgi:hypothetical protein
VTIKPALALAGWVAFNQMEREAMVMGDLVLLENEINPVMKKMMASGIIITAVHNHLLRANPPTYYMHIGGHGDAIAMATAIRIALMESKTPLGRAQPAMRHPQSSLILRSLTKSWASRATPMAGSISSAFRAVIPSQWRACR